VFDCIAHRTVIPFDKRCQYALENLGLYEVAQIQHVKTDHRLITALVEHWRPKTHTFHMPVGEVTVTLQDVSCLWVLSINGDHIVGPSDQDLQQLIETNLGVDMSRALLKSIKKKGEENDDEVVQSGYRISLNLLRVKFKKLDDNATVQDVARYTRAFILDMFSSVLFPDTSGDSVSVMYLRFLQNFNTPRNLNWVRQCLLVFIEIS
jgi:Plant mobile domain